MKYTWLTLLVLSVFATTLPAGRWLERSTRQATGQPGQAIAFSAGDGRDGELVVRSGETRFGDDVRAIIQGGVAAGQTVLAFNSSADDVVLGGQNLLPDVQWADTGLRVAAGDRLQVVADSHGHPDLHAICYGGGTALCYNSDGSNELAPTGWTAPGIRKYSLVGRIGNGPPFFVGSSFNAPVRASGLLYLGLNDCDGCFAENTYRQANVQFTFDLSIRHSTLTGFRGGDQVLIIQMTGPNAGQYELAAIQHVGAGVLNLQAPLKYTYTTSGLARAQVLRVPQYSKLTIQAGGTYVARHWGGYTGGIIALMVSEMLYVAPGGRIEASRIGFAGGREVTWDQESEDAGPGFQGASHLGTPQQMSQRPNAGGGGGGRNGGGGGGAYQSTGAPGLGEPSTSVPGLGGEAYGAEALERMFLGSGGGGGGHALESAAAGGRGGGIIFMVAEAMDIQGTIDAGGQGGWQGQYGGETFAPATLIRQSRAGGGGAGGSVKLLADRATIGANVIKAQGGPGGRTSDGLGQGGSGSAGRIRIETCTPPSAAYTTLPAASVYQLLCDILPPTARFLAPAPGSRVAFGVPLTLRWEGQDDPIGSGIKSFTISQESPTITANPLLTSDGTQGNIPLSTPCQMTTFKLIAYDQADNMSVPDELTVMVSIQGDINLDGQIDMVDMQAVEEAWGARDKDSAYRMILDLNLDNRIDAADSLWVRRHLGDACPAP